MDFITLIHGTYLKKKEIDAHYLKLQTANDWQPIGCDIHVRLNRQTNEQKQNWTTFCSDQILPIMFLWLNFIRFIFVNVCFFLSLPLSFSLTLAHATDESVEFEMLLFFSNYNNYTFNCNVSFVVYICSVCGFCVQMNSIIHNTCAFFFLLLRILSTYLMFMSSHCNCSHYSCFL